MSLIGLLKTFQVHYCALLKQQHVFYFTVIATVNWTVQLDYQECKLSANIRYVYVLGCFLVTFLLVWVAICCSGVLWIGVEGV